jgi:hypothetical protein
MRCGDELSGLRRSEPSADRGLAVVIVRIAVGVAVVAASGLVLSAAIRRVVRGVALLFAGTVAFVVGGYLILSGLWRVIRSRRRSRE